MRVECLGDGDPSVAVVGGVHGDEPCGIRAVEDLMDDPPDVQRPVKLILANEAAIERGVRYVDRDLNRAYPGDPNSSAHEDRIAHDLADELEGCTTLSLHSTQSHPEPFAIVAGVSDLAREVTPRLSVVAVVDTGPFVEGRLLQSPDTIELECGLQQSPAAAENAADLTREFLTVTGVLPGDREPTERPLYRLTRSIPKVDGTEYEVPVHNFERVAAGDVYAVVDGRSSRAEADFYPVLMSAYGYDEVFGYAADRIGTVP